MAKRTIEMSFYVLISIAVLMLFFNLIDLIGEQSRHDFLQTVSISVLLAFLIAILLLIYLYRDSFVRSFPRDRILGLLEKKVYTSAGDYVGEVEDILISDNTIYGIKVKPKKKSSKKILFKSSAILNYGEVVVVDSKFSDKLEQN